MKVTTIGFDLAKNVFQVHGVDERGQVVVRKQLRRDQVAAFFANLPAVSGRHGGLRQCASLGPQAAGVRSQCSVDIAAVREAVCQEQQERRGRRRGDMRGGSPTEHALRADQDVEQQAVLSVHRVRQGFVKARTAQANQIRGLVGRVRAGHPARDHDIVMRGCRD